LVRPYLLKIIRRCDMPVRKAEAVWEGSLKDGKGKMNFGSGAYEGAYSFASRFGDGAGTNPEELIGAAHAGCFSMALSLFLENAGFRAERIKTIAKVHIDKVGDGFKITVIELETEARVPGIDEKKFFEQAEAAKKGCPVSQALAGVEIRLKAKLLSA
jgi:lipoyl-dependent peroxiredoxin